MTTLFMGLSVYFVVSVIRTLLSDTQRTSKLLLHKPFNCDLCMSWWCALPMWLDRPLSELISKDLAFEMLAVMAISMVMLKITRRLDE